MTGPERFPVRFERAGVRRRAPLAKAARALLAEGLDALGQPEAQVSMLFCGEARIRQLKRDWFGEDRATDVLSFPSGEGPREYLGDLALCVPFAARQAVEAEKSAPEEMALLLVHGLLHLLGHDHDTAERKKAMWAEQRRLLKLPAARAFAEMAWEAGNE
ncbi:MAG: rRNA maturation RNase YbeY [Candidatus Sumerlaeia bacterium]|nr:rRNA maturation RNase YbeY [Candidatus Sumerlaeia bacterium]